MHINIQKAVFLFTALFSVYASPVYNEAASDLKIEVTGLRNDNGFVLLSLYNHKSGYPSNPDEAYWKIKEKIKDGKAYFVYKALPPGTYAIAILHDENANLKMDTRLLGIPKEGYGFSQNPTLWFGAPSFKSSSFQHNAEQLVVIPVRY